MSALGPPRPYHLNLRGVPVDERRIIGRWTRRAASLAELALANAPYRTVERATAAASLARTALAMVALCRDNVVPRRRHLP